MKKNKDLIVIYIVAFVVYVITFLNNGVVETPDSPTYISAWEVISNGRIDMFRTPVYPIYLGIMKFIFGLSYYKIMAIIGQYILFFFSIYIFYNISQRFFSQSKIHFGITLIYGICPSIYQYCSMIMTETMAVSGCVFLIYCLCHLYDEYSLKWSIFYTLTVLFLIMLRPSFVYVFPVLIIAFLLILRNRQKKKQAVMGFVGLAISSVFLLSYMATFNHNYGIFSSSAVGVINRFYIQRQYGLIDVESISNDDFREEIENNIQLHGVRHDNLDSLWEETYKYIDKYGVKDVNDVINCSFRSHPWLNISKVGGRFIKSAYTPAIYIYPHVKLFDLFFIYLFGFVYTILMICWIIQKREIPWMSSFLYLLCLGNLVMIIAGAQDQWGRLFAPSLPLCLLLVGQFCSFFLPLNQIKMK